jgi:hypothetical protein
LVEGWYRVAEPLPLLHEVGVAQDGFSSAVTA